MSQEDVVSISAEDLHLADRKEELTKQLAEVLKDAPIPEDSTSTEKEYSTEESVALSQGWDPEKEFTAAEYLRRGELFKKISTQSEQIKEMRDTLKNLSNHVTQTEKAAYQRALSELTEKRDQAIENGDKDAFYYVEQQTKTLQKEMDAKVISEPAPEPQEPHDAVKDFAKRNAEWFNDKPENKEMVEAALIIDNSIHGANPSIDPGEAVKLIETRLKKIYPEKFQNQNRTAPGVVTTSTTSRTSGTSPSALVSKMTSQQLEIGKQFVRYTPGYTLERYADELNKQGNLGK